MPCLALRLFVSAPPPGRCAKPIILKPIVYFAASFCDILLQLRQWRNAPTPPAACRHQPRGHTHTHTDTYDLAPELSYHTTYAPHTPRCCVPLLLAEKTCVEPVLARVVQVLVKIDHVVLHTCAWHAAGASERVATWGHFGPRNAPRPRASSSVSSVAAGSDSVGAGTLALLRTGTSRKLSSVGCIFAPSTCSHKAATKWNR